MITIKVLWGRLSCTLVALALTGCSTVMDDALGYRGPIALTITSPDGVQPEHPFVVQSANVEVSGHFGNGVERGYEYTRLGQADTPIIFPRARLDLLHANVYARIQFTIHHPLYRYSYIDRGYPPTPGDKPIPVTVEMRPLEAMLAEKEKKAEQLKAAMKGLDPNSKAYSRLEDDYDQTRFSLGRVVKQQIQAMKVSYLPYLSPAQQAAVKAKYNPIFKALFYRYPETDCYEPIFCQRQIKKPRKYKYEGL